MIRRKKKHEVNISKIPLRYKTDTETHQSGEIVPYKYKYIPCCIHGDCYDTLFGKYVFTNLSEAESWKKAHLAKYKETYGQRVLRRADGLWGEIKITFFGDR